MSVLEVENLVVKYGQTVAVDGISFSVEEGAFVTLLGPSGCGKTTTLRCIAGLERAAGGSISIAGTTVSGAGKHVRPEDRDINMVFQSYAVWPHMSVFENVAYGLRVRRIAKREVRERVEEALSRVGLERYGDRFGTELSGGQQQRVALARAIVTEPKILLFDEPLSNLDAGLREQMRYELVELQKSIGRTAIYVTHDQAEAMVMSDTILLMRDGLIEQEAPPRELYRRPTSRFAGEFVGAANVFRGIVSSVAKGLAVVRVSDGFLIEVELPPAAQVEEGSEATVLVRPEDVSLGRVDRGLSNTWSAVVKRAAFVGNKNEFALEVAGETLRAEGHAAADMCAGEHVHIQIDPDRVIWLSESTQMRSSVSMGL